MRAAVVVGMVLLCGIAQGAEPKTVTNTIGMVLIDIPAGTFTMGSPAGEKGRSDREEQVAVTLTKPFWLGKTEVTQGQFKKVMGTTPWKGRDKVQIDKNGAVSYVSWDDAIAFCAELTELEQDAGTLKVGEPYRLPTEAEWEYACRAGTKTKFSFGDDEKQLGEYAWFAGNAFDAGEQYAHAVGMKKPNPWGLHDMHGNVSEWCFDGCDAGAKELPGGVDPVGPRNALGSDWRVKRNANWRSTPDYCRSAYRINDLRQLRSKYTDDGFGPDAAYLGFRVARSQSAQ